MTNDAPHQTTTGDAITVTTDPANLVLLKLSRAILAVTADDATDEDFLRAMDIEATATRLLKEFKARLTDAKIEYLHRVGEANRTPQDDPDRPLYGSVHTTTGRYYVGVKRTTKCRDVPLAVDAVLNACGGDFDQFMRCLASQPLKHGACAAVLGSEWARHFKVEEQQDVKTGKPTRTINKSQE